MPDPRPLFTLAFLLSALFLFPQCAGSGGEQDGSTSGKEEQESSTAPTEKNLKIYYMEISRQEDPFGSSEKDCTNTACYVKVAGEGSPRLFVDLKNCDTSLAYTEIRIIPRLRAGSEFSTTLEGRRLSQLEPGRPITIPFEIPADFPLDSLSAVSIDGQWKVGERMEEVNWLVEGVCGSRQWAVGSEQ